MHTFWSINDTGKLVISITEIYDFLNDRGYCIEYQGTGKVLYKVTDHLIDLADVDDLTGEIIHYLKNELRESTSRYIEFARKPDQTFTFNPAEILEAVTKFGFKRIFDEINWKYFNPLSVEVKKHTENSAFFYFKNGFIEVSKNNNLNRQGARFLNYSNLSPNEKIYKPLLIDRDIQIIDTENENQINLSKRGYDFLHFLHMISSFNDEDNENDINSENQTNDEKLGYLMRLIGYCLHDFKEKGKTDFAPFLCDEEIGGTGKGTLLQAIAKLIDPHQDNSKYKPSICEVDGKRKDEKFDSNNLNPETRLKVYNDLKRGFDLEKPFNEITDSASIRQMWGGTITVPYDKSWKVLLIANYTPGKGDGASLRRYKVFYMTPFFNRNKTIIEYYGHTFWGREWSDDDWNFFYNIMFWCAKLWLSSDYKVKYEDPEYLQYKIENTYYSELTSFIDSLKDGVYLTGELYNNFKNDIRWRHEDRIKSVNRTVFGRKMRDYMDEIGRKYHKSKDRKQITIGKPPHSTKDQMHLNYRGSVKSSNGTN